MNSRSRLIKWLAIAALVFGTLTIFSGGRALFGSDEARAALGNVVPFVLWFNFTAGFVYVVAGIGLLLVKPWATPTAVFLAAATVLVSMAMAIYAASGGAFEMRTVGALIIRSLFWITIAFVAIRAVKSTSPGLNP
ncbi:MAG: hypothetical protein K9J42_09720 [Sulfuritalea sp.]|nr:hypothetical protein [Sulfuritalea sp.]